MLPIPPEKVLERGRLQPGRMFLVDTDQGRILDDTEVKGELAAEQPYRDWVHAGLMRLTDLPAREHVTVSHRSVLPRQQIFGYTEEELRVLITPMAASGAEGIGSMGTDTPEAVLSDPAPAHLRLLQPAVRAGHQPAAGRHPGSGRHLAVLASSARRRTCSSPARGPAGRSCCRSRCWTTTTWPS